MSGQTGFEHDHDNWQVPAKMSGEKISGYSRGSFGEQFVRDDDHDL